jgi:serine/threonine-protein kinase
MSPEQLRGGPLDARADLFSLAVLLYEVAVGQSPFAATTDAQLLFAVREARLVPPEALVRAAGPELANVLHRAMRAHPAERYASAAEMAQALMAVVADTLASEKAAASGAAREGREPSPFSAALLEIRGDEER